MDITKSYDEFINKPLIPKIVLSEAMEQNKVITIDKITYYMHPETAQKVIKVSPFLLDCIQNKELLLKN